MLQNAKRPLLAGASREHAANPPPRRPLGWRDTRLGEMIGALFTRHGDEPWIRSNHGLMVLLLVAIAALLMALAAAISAWE